jgi:AcrR family transcriptional regulator
MSDRKQHVIKMAHQLFIEKGFQATSIQDILDYSGISKGTFYNYFSSKNELLIALFKSIYKKLEQERSELLIGQDPANVDIFIKQIELQMNTNRSNKLISLYEEVNFSNDVELKQLIKLGQLRMIRWLHQRFIELFDESKQPYLLDCAIMFMGILQQNIKYSALAYDANVSIHKIVRFSVERIIHIVDDVSKSEVQLIPPDVLEKWFPDCQHAQRTFHQDVNQTVSTLKNFLHNNNEMAKYIEFLDFIQDELLHAKVPRKYLLENALLSLRDNQAFTGNQIFENLNQLVADYLSQQEKVN